MASRKTSNTSTDQMETLPATPSDSRPSPFFHAPSRPHENSNAEPAMGLTPLPNPEDNTRIRMRDITLVVDKIFEIASKRGGLSHDATQHLAETNKRMMATHVRMASQLECWIEDLIAALREKGGNVPNLASVQDSGQLRPREANSGMTAALSRIGESLPLPLLTLQDATELHVELREDEHRRHQADAAFEAPGVNTLRQVPKWYNRPPGNLSTADALQWIREEEAAKERHIRELLSLLTSVEQERDRLQVKLQAANVGHMRTLFSLQAAHRLIPITNAALKNSIDALEANIPALYRRVASISPPVSPPSAPDTPQPRLSGTESRASRALTTPADVPEMYTHRQANSRTPTSPGREPYQGTDEQHEQGPHHEARPIDNDAAALESPTAILSEFMDEFEPWWDDDETADANTTAASAHAPRDNRLHVNTAMDLEDERRRKRKRAEIDDDDDDNDDGQDVPDAPSAIPPPPSWGRTRAAR